MVADGVRTGAAAQRAGRQRPRALPNRSERGSEPSEASPKPQHHRTKTAEHLSKHATGAGGLVRTDTLDSRSGVQIRCACQSPTRFFSVQLDLDYASLRAFPDSYKVLESGRRGPTGGDARKVVLSEEGLATLYGGQQNEALRWYRYLFRGRASPAPAPGSSGRWSRRPYRARCRPSSAGCLTTLSRRSRSIRRGGALVHGCRCAPRLAPLRDRRPGAERVDGLASQGEHLRRRWARWGQDRVPCAPRGLPPRDRPLPAAPARACHRRHDA
jgi:hypothetical protein